MGSSRSFSKSNLSLARIQPTILRPSDSHNFEIPSLGCSSTSVNEQLSYQNCYTGARSNSLLAPPVLSRLQHRPSVTADSVVTGRNHPDTNEKWELRVPSQHRPVPFFVCRSRTLSSDDKTFQRKGKQLTKQDKIRIALYERAGDTYGNIVGWDVDVRLSPYGFPVLQQQPKYLKDESVFQKKRSLKTQGMQDDMANQNSVVHRRIHIEKTLSTSTGSTWTLCDDHELSVDVAVTYDAFGKITVSALALSGLAKKKRIVFVIKLASHKIKKRSVGPLVQKSGQYEHEGEVPFLRVPESHLELSQLKLEAYEEKRAFGCRKLVGTTTIPLQGLAVGQMMFSRPLLPVLSHKDLGRLRLTMCYHSDKRRLLLVVVRASNLPRKVLPPDTFVRVWLQGPCGKRTVKKRTKTKRCTSSPVYKEIFAFDLPRRSIDVWDFKEYTHPLDDVTVHVTLHRKTLLSSKLIGGFELKSEMRINGYSHLSKCKRAPYQQISGWHDFIGHA